MIFFRKLHKWLGLVIGVQFIIWLMSGLLISFVDMDQVSGSVTRHEPVTEAPLVSAGPFIPLSEIPIAGRTTEAIYLEHFITGPVYRLISRGESTLWDATTGTIVRIDKSIAQELARNSYRGSGALLTAQRLESGSNEVRDATGAVWRVDFDDPLSTRIYVSDADGSVLAHRNSRWKLVDILLMLHFMDYGRSDSFNSPWIIAVGFGTLWIAMSGLLLAINSFSRADFLWIPGIDAGSTTVRSRVSSAAGAERQIEVSESLSYYAALSQQDVRLPSNCDGSGSCGLCRIRFEENIPEHTAVDREWIDTDSLAGGIRLACQHRPRAGDAIVVPDMAFQQGIQFAEVIGGRWLTPLLKEIRLRPYTTLDFAPGDYLEFQVPAFDTDRERMNAGPELHALWNDLHIPQHWSYTHKGRIARTYSIATAAVSAQPQELIFTVRFAPPPAGSEFLPGAGSSFMCSRQVGDRIEFRGPAGDFGLIDSDKEKILIGGGAGMAPLKAMALHLLRNQGWRGTLRYWYGARNQAEILYKDTFDSLAKEHANFEWQVVLSEADEDREWTGHRGLVHEVVFNKVLKAHRDIQECEFYLCGPPQMLVATRRMLRDLGLPDSSVRFDDFGN